MRSTRDRHSTVWAPRSQRTGVKTTEEMLWLLGEEGYPAFAGYPEWKDRSSASFPHTGLYLSHARESFWRIQEIATVPISACSSYDLLHISSDQATTTTPFQ